MAGRLLPHGMTRPAPMQQGVILMLREGTGPERNQMKWLPKVLERLRAKAAEERVAEVAEVTEVAEPGEAAKPEAQKSPTPPNMQTDISPDEPPDMPRTEPSPPALLPEHADTSQQGDLPGPDTA